MEKIIFILVGVIAVFIVTYRKKSGENVYKFFAKQVGSVYNKYAPYSFKEVRQKVKELGQEYTVKQYTLQITVFAAAAGILTYLYFYNIIISIIYAIASIMVVPYLTYLRCKRVYSEFIFEQVQVYCTNTIMEFATTQSFVKAIEGVYSSGVLEDPFKSDVKVMIDMAYENGTIEQSIEYLNNKYDYYVIKNMHQLFLQIMSLDIDMLVEGVYRDRIDRANFHRKFLQFGIMLYLMVMLVQFLLGIDTYISMLSDITTNILLHAIILVNTYFILNGEKYYNENVGAE